MGNREQLQRLKQGIPEWNRWRRQHPDLCPDLSEANLSKADPSGADLSEVNLWEANLSKADLSGADLSEVNLGYADLRKADLRGADLQKASLNGVNLQRADLSQADLRGIPWPTIMELTLQPGMIWKDVRYDHTDDE